MLTIGKLAHSAGVSSDTLRYYEQEGLIEPAGKSPAGYRLYDQDSARRLRFHQTGPAVRLHPRRDPRAPRLARPRRRPLRGCPQTRDREEAAARRQDPLDARDVQGA